MFERVHKKNRYIATKLLAAAAIAGCGGNSDNEGVRFTFDDLDGGSPIIQVYPGPEDTQEHRVNNGTYLDGTTEIAECVTEGRDVYSDSSPEVGEIKRSSNKWLRFEDNSGEHYATAVYIENPQQVIEQLSDC